MPVFIYEVVDRRGKKLKAKQESPNIQTLKERLRKEGFIPLSIAPHQAKQFNLFQHIKTKDLLVFTQELASLLEAGLSLDRAILVLANHSEKVAFRDILNNVYRDIQRGNSLSQALARHKVFPKLYINMVRAGEAGGILEPVLRRVASFLETTAAFKEEILSALIYPVLLTLVGALSIVVIMLYVIPKFVIIFEDMGQVLPSSTLILLNVSSAVSSYWWIAAGIIVGGIFLLKKYARTEDGRLFFDRLLLKTPLISRLQAKIFISSFSRTLGTLLKSGVPILTAIRIAREVVGNAVISEKLRTLEEGVKKGRGVTQPLRECRVFPEVVLQMVAVGEEAGRLEDTFLNIAERFEGESRSLIKRLISFIEPALILFMGLVIGFIVISMLLGIFSINELPL
ncbi:type II secretion system protein F [bacterium BMS3Bbin07]|nr:type II secretion system protein F [bacterium BMS3Bbin07]HDH01539.1 type II secretion system F family protein [Nitrospirota bacterium]